MQPPRGAASVLPQPSAARAGTAGLRRSADLLRAFRVEQTDPARFYGLLARDSVRMVGEHGSLAGRTVLDVGAGPVQFAAAFAAAGARYVALDADPAELRTRPAVAGRGERLPVADRSVDVCFSSNVVEHVPAPWRFADELVRVTRPGGLVVVAYTNWLSPWGGHETSPWHYLGGYPAAERYGRRYGHPPKNRYGAGLYPVSVAAGLRWATGRPDAELVDARPRYLPAYARRAAAGAGAARDRDLEPLAGAAPPMTDTAPSLVRRLRITTAAGGSRRARVQPGPGPADRRHQVRPGARPGHVPAPGAGGVGPAAGLRRAGTTSRTATCGRWGRSSGSATSSGCPAGRCSAAGGRCCSWSASPARSSWPARSASAPRRPGCSAALAYALSPRVLSVLGTISVEAWPAAVLPWILLPLVRGAARAAQPASGRGLVRGGRALPRRGERDRVRRGAPAAAALPAHPAGRRPRPAAGLVGPVTVLAASWWALPLLLLGRYGYDFLDVIESAKVTTSVTGLVDTLRGGDHWLGYLVVDGRPVWTAGWELATGPGLVVVTTLVAAAGLAGLLLPGLAGPALAARRRAARHGAGRGRAHRRAHRPARVDAAVGAGRSAGAAAQRAQGRPGAAAAARARPCPPARGGEPGGRAGRPSGAGAVRGRGRGPGRRRAGRGDSAAGMGQRAGAAGHVRGHPGVLAAGRGLARPARRRRADAAAAVRERADLPVGHAAGRAAAGAGVRALGGPRRRPARRAGQHPAARRPGRPAGHRRAVARVRRRAGPGRRPVRAAAQRPRPGPVRVRAAGGDPGRAGRLARADRGRGRSGRHSRPAFRSGDRLAGAAAPDPAAVEVFAIAGAERIAAYPDDGAVALSGGPEGVLSLADAGLLDGRAVMGTIDAEAADAADDAEATDEQPLSTLAEAGTGSDDDAVVQTDTQRRRAYNPGADPGRRYSATLSAADPLPRPDLGPYDAAEQAVSVLEGASNVTASSSADDPFAADPAGSAHRGPDHRPAAAVDGDPQTAWVSAAGTVGQHLDLSLLRRMRLREVTVDLVTDPALGPEVTSVAVTTDAGTVSAPVRRGRATVPLPARVDLADPGHDHRRGRRPGLRRGRHPRADRAATWRSPRRSRCRRTRTPPAGSGPCWPSARTAGAATACAARPAGPACPGWPSRARRAARWSAGSRRRPGTSRSPARSARGPGPGLDRLLDETLGYLADGTSRITVDPAARPGAAYDGDPTTAWLPALRRPGPAADARARPDGHDQRAHRRGLDRGGRVELTTRTGERRTLTGTGVVPPGCRTDEVTLTFRRRDPGRRGRADGAARVRPHAARRPGRPARSRWTAAPAPAVVLDGRARNLSIPRRSRTCSRWRRCGRTICGPPIKVAGGPHRMSVDRDRGAGGRHRGGVQRAAAGGPAGPADPHRLLVRPAPGGRRRRRDEGLPGDGRGLQRRLAGHRGRPHADPGPDGRLAAGSGSCRPAPPPRSRSASAPAATQHGLLLAGLVAALLVLGLARYRAGGRPAAPRPAAADPGRWWRAAPVAAVGVLLTGSVGLVAAAAALALPRRWWAAAAGGCLAVAGVLLAIDPGARWVQAADQGLAAAALCVVTAALADWLPPGDPIGPPQRAAARPASTTVRRGRRRRGR